MQFVKLTHSVLRELKLKGYNILRSTSKLSNDDPTWMPDTVDLDAFFDLGSLEIERISTPMEELHLLVIDDALKNIRDEDLIGSVFLGTP